MCEGGLNICGVKSCEDVGISYSPRHLLPTRSRKPHHSWVGVERQRRPNGPFIMRFVALLCVGSARKLDPTYTTARRKTLRPA